MAIIYTSSDDYLTRYFAYLSGENIELAKAELLILLRLLSKDVRVFWKGRLAIIESVINPSEFVLSRAALTQRAGSILYESDSVECPNMMESDNEWMNFIFPSDSFSVKTLCVNIEIEPEKRKQIEREFGAYIKTVKGAGVNLRNASVQILVILSDSGVLVCNSAESMLRIDLRNREPGKKSFFHPSMMNSALARVMCNFAEIMPGDVVLDPFCGGGGILCEASYIGASVIGADLNWKLLIGAKKNLDEINQNYSILQADVQRLPITSVDCIVTDPPYGRASSTRGTQSVKLVETMLGRIDSIIQSKGEHVCLCGSAEMNLPQLVQNNGFLIGQHFRIRVHSGLVREIVTIRI